MPLPGMRGDWNFDEITNFTKVLPALPVPSQTSCLAPLSAAAACLAPLPLPDGTGGPGGPGPSSPAPDSRGPGAEAEPRPAPSSLRGCRTLPAPPGAHPRAGLASRHTALPPPGGAAAAGAEPAVPRPRGRAGPGCRCAAAPPSPRSVSAWAPRRPRALFGCGLPGSSAAASPPRAPLPSLPCRSLPSGPALPGRGLAAPHAPRQPRHERSRGAPRPQPALPGAPRPAHPSALPVAVLSPAREAGDANFVFFVPRPPTLCLHLPGVEPAILTLKETESEL